MMLTDAEVVAASGRRDCCWKADAFEIMARRARERVKVAIVGVCKMPLRGLESCVVSSVVIL